MNSPASKPPVRHSLLANLAFNILIPTLILTKLSGDKYELLGFNLALGIQWALIVALAFPLIYGGRDLLQSGKVNIFSVLGIFSVLVNGGVGLLEGDRHIIIIKEAAIPALIGLAALISLKTRFPLIKTLLFNDQVIDIQKVDNALQQHNSHKAFNQRLVNGTYMLFATMMLSALLNYLLADYMIVAQSGTEEFNAQVGKFMGMQLPVIGIPIAIATTATLFYLFRGVTQLTGLPLEEIILTAPSSDTKEESN
ncbi:VC0807 family protein [Porticoccus sp. W117]|uniref:VC0807 family protein n=1 Tax=Porticoccus sp. W117 TaxID=3054777 RepID=UPI0025984B7E|nr:VC0807 family protein [Porticoccus sp. W117]MDM3872106.1 VC0807 family protein [Porticoccus sp. W117]